MFSMISTYQTAGKAAKRFASVSVALAVALAGIALPTASYAERSAPNQVELGTLTVLAVDATYKGAAPGIEPSVIAAAQVLVFDEYGELVAEGETDASGLYDTAIPAGAYRLSVNAKSFNGYHTYFKIAVGQDTHILAAMEAIAEADGDIDVETNGTFSLYVRDGQAGKGVAGAAVAVRSLDGFPDVIIAEGKTDADGNFATLLAEGAYAAEIAADGYKVYTLEFKIVAGELTVMAAALEPDYLDDSTGAMAR